MKKVYRVYKTNLIEALQIMSDYNLQRNLWLARERGMVGSFTEQACQLFDDTGLIDAIRAEKIVFDNVTHRSLSDLHEAVSTVNEFRSPQEILDDPRMQIVREKAAKALELVMASTGEDSTVEIIE